MKSTRSPLLVRPVVESVEIGSALGVFETERSRNFINAFRRIDPVAQNLHNPSEHTFEVWWSPTHLVGYFSDIQVQMMIDDWASKGKSFRMIGESL